MKIHILNIIRLLGTSLLLVCGQAQAVLGGGGGGGGGGGAADITPPAVTVSIAGGAYNSAQSITLSANEPATIYYTLNGSTPTTASPVYSVSVEIYNSATLQYFAVDTAHNASAVQSQTYTISYLPPSAPTGFAVRFITPTHIGFTWANSVDNTGVTEYKIYRNETLAGAAPVMSFSDTGLTASTPYIYNVAACNGAGNCSAQSAPIVITTLAASDTMVVAPQIAAGEGHTVAIKQDGSLWAWGASGSIFSNDYGQLGTSTPQRTPVQVGVGYIAVAAGAYHTLAIKADGSLWAWGRNNAGQLGIGSPDNMPHPSPVQIGTGFTSVSAGGGYSVAVKADGSLWAWGSGANQNQANSPVQIGNGYAAASTGWNHAIALKADGRLWAWGDDSWGQVGDGTSVSRFSLVQIGTGFTSIAAGSDHSAAIKMDGSLWGWGKNDYGQIGAGPYGDVGLATYVSRSPIQVGTDFISVAAGAYYSAAIKSDGSLWTWGANFRGQLGIGTSDFGAHPDPIQVGTGFSSVAATPTHNASTTGGHVAAIKADGSLWAWGDNGYGQIGDGTTTDRLSPVQVSTGFTPVTLTTGLIPLFTGWNLLGNSSDAPLDVATTLWDAAKVSTVWKWLPATGKWAFYTPSMTLPSLADYAASKGYVVLATINAGEGFWVNAKIPFTAQMPTGNALPAATFQTMLTPGWNLVSVGENKTPGQFNTALSLTQLATGAIPINITTLWAWDNAQSNWYFYAPGLEAQGGTALADYIATKGYLDFTAASKTLGQCVGFWVNKP